MRVRLIAVGTRAPAWVRAACEDYITRLGSRLKVSVTEIGLSPRSGGASPARAMAREGERVLAALRSDDYLVALDERGTEFTTRELAAWLEARMREGVDLAFVIGGPDGLAPEVFSRARLRWSLSRLTLPHALVRVVLAEQLYRAMSLIAGHPYHRD
ncbi:MAG TPA: 23S rRNA (pseudouridine(1915)-N(3))-methyltransferase RlmH [Steroidobacteraceae bacterium]|jgi:23S rRNA (pseudouridine1915-N3)-methyltransferase|nr:23S rRNA (pseudouridine(1915)-N(3))-methyltransferase RlmH [Steroidobacteraceae bacterium]